MPLLPAPGSTGPPLTKKYGALSDDERKLIERLMGLASGGHPAQNVGALDPWAANLPLPIGSHGNPPLTLPSVPGAPGAAPPGGGGGDPFGPLNEHQFALGSRPIGYGPGMAVPYFDQARQQQLLRDDFVQGPDGSWGIRGEGRMINGKQYIYGIGWS